MCRTGIVRYVSILPISGLVVVANDKIAHIPPSVLARRELEDADVCDGEPAARASGGDVDELEVCY